MEEREEVRGPRGHAEELDGEKGVSLTPSEGSQGTGESDQEYARRAASQPIFNMHTAKEAAAQQEILRETGPYLTLGIQLALSIAAFFGIGYWLDHHFGTGSLWTAIFSGFGAIASLAYFIVTVLRLSKNEERKHG